MGRAIAARRAEVRSPAARAEQAWQELNRWLGQGENGDRWRQYLLAQELESQWKAAAPDAATLGAVLDRLRGTHAGLSAAKFLSFRQALRGWIDTLVVTPAEQLPDLATAARTSYRAGEDERLLALRGRLQQALGRLDQFLARDRVQGPAWKSYLHWQELQTELEKGTGADAKVLEEVARRFRSGEAGLELAPFADVHALLVRYLPQARLLARSAGPTPQERFANLMSGLAKRLRDFGPAPLVHPREEREIGLILGWLEEHAQAPDIVQAVRRHYAQPNAYVRVADDLIALGMGGPVDRNNSVHEFILGTTVVGSGRTQGTISVSLVPNEEIAAFETRFHGRVHTSTTGYNGPAIVYTQGETQISAQKRLFLNEQGLFALPALSRASTRTTITGIDSTAPGLRGCLVRRIAARKANKQLGQAEQVAAGKASRQFNAQMDREATDLLSRGNQTLSDRFRRPLMRRRSYPPRFEFRTTAETLELTALFAATQQLAATGPPPALAGDSTLAVRVHESSLNNVVFNLFAGETLTQEKLEAKLIDILGRLPEEFQDDEEREPWSITFDAAAPLSVEFRDQALVIVLRGSRYTSGDGKYGAMNVTARYQLAQGPRGWGLVRPAELEILPPGFDPASGEKLSLRQTTLRNLLKRRFDKIFKSRIDLENFALPDRWEKAGAFLLAEQGSADGWLKLSWRHDPTRKPLPAEESVAAWFALLALRPLERVRGS